MIKIKKATLVYMPSLGWLLNSYSVAARPNNVVRGVDFGERRAAPYNSSVERTRLRRYALLGITALRAAQPREGVAHLAPR